MKIRVPATIDVDAVIADLRITRAKRLNMKNHIYYFLSIIATTNDNFELREKEDGYYLISSIRLKKIFGDRNYPFMISVLSNPNNPIIEINNSYQNSHPDKSKNYTKGYRLVEKYDTGDFNYKSVPVKLKSKIDRYNKIKNIEIEKLQANYAFLLNKYDEIQFGFDEKINEYIRSFSLKLHERVEDNNEYQIAAINNKIGRWLYYIEMMKPDNLWKSISVKNHRLNTSFSSMPKVLRPFILCNNSPLNCIDVSSCQPYILSSIMNDKFFNDKTENEYNLNTIYPELYKELNGNIDIQLNDSIGNNIYDSISSIVYYSSISGNTNNYLFNTNISSPSFMWCSFLNNEDITNISSYSNAPFYLDFYSHLVDKHNSNSTTFGINKDMLRKEIKSNMMYLLFDNNFNHRNNNATISLFKAIYPGVNKWIEKMLRKVGGTKFSYLLQRAESFLLLNKVSREFYAAKPNAPIFTIHDGLFVTEDNTRYLLGLLKHRLHEITGVLAGAKITEPEINIEPSIDDVNEVWDKIAPIRTKAAFDKKKEKRAILQSNIQRALDFL